MKEHPILFSGPMVRAILDGRKTQTRRVVNPQPKVVHDFYPDGTLETERLFRNGRRIRCPYGVRGDRLWVRETCYLTAGGDDGEPMCVPPVSYAADGPVNRERYPFVRPSIHMPRWASRITLEVVDLAVQPLQTISDEDAIAEGVEQLFSEAELAKHPECWCDPMPYKNYLWHGLPGKRCTEQFSSKKTARESFASLWDSINADRAPWDSSPWVWAVTFRRVPHA
jgi:hypothetical protein